jgi:hypothetical protein
MATLYAALRPFAEADLRKVNQASLTMAEVIQRARRELAPDWQPRWE